MPRKPHNSPNWGGVRPGSGRKNPDKYTRDLVRRAHDEGIHPFDLLIKVVRDEKANKKDRMYCATALMPYCAQRLQQTEVKITSDLDGLTVTEKIALASSLRSDILEHNPDATLPSLALVNGEDIIDGELVQEVGK
jgi:hypothetical protein